MAWHARLGASSTKQWLTCPGSAAYVQHYKIPQRESWTAANEGTAAHLLVELCLRDGHEPADYIGRLIEIVDGDGKLLHSRAKKQRADSARVVIEVDDDMVRATTCMTDYVRRRVDELGVTMDSVQLEQRVHPLPGKYQDVTGGTGDVIIDAWPELLEIVDYKHGRGVYVPVEDNPQLMTYALGAMRQSQEKNETGYADSYAAVQYTICQPRHSDAPAGGISTQIKKPEELIDFGDMLRTGVDRVVEALQVCADGGDLNELHERGYLDTGPKGEACTWCPLLNHNCPAATERVFRTVAGEFDEYENAETAAAITFENINQDSFQVPSSEVSLAVLLPLLPFLKKYIQGVEEAALGHVLDGGKINGYKLVEKRASRKWASDYTVDDIERVADKYGLSSKDYINPPSLRTAVQVMSKVSKELRSEFAEQFVDNGEASYAIAIVDDKRPEAVLDPAAEFAALDDEV